MKKEELIAKMAEQGYTKILSDKNYVMCFIHNNGISTANFQKRENWKGEEVWELCF